MSELEPATWKHEREALLRERDLLRSIVDTIPVMITRYDPATRVLYLNDEFERVVGWSSADVQSIDLMTAVYPDPEYREMVRAYMLEARCDWREFAVRARDGRVVLSQWSNILLADGTQIGIGIDVTARRQAERELQISMRRYRDLIAYLEVGVVIHAPDTRIVVSNPKASELLGLSPEQMQGTSALDPRWHFLNEEGDRLAVADYPVNDIVRTGAAIHNRIYGVYRIDLERVIWLAVTGFPSSDERGEVTEITMSFMDVSAQRHHTEEMRRQLQEKTTLLQEVHHRIKNNFASIEGLLSLQLNASDQPEVRSALGDASRRVGSMRVLYDTLLTHDEFALAPVKSYVERLLDTIMALFPANGTIEVRAEIADFDLGSGQLIPLGIIINELLTNTMKYAFEGRERGRIELTIHRQGARVRVTVRDDGCGLPDGFAAHQSHGLGLLLVRMLTEQLEGSFTISSQKGTVSVLTFEVPELRE